MSLFNSHRIHFSVVSAHTKCSIWFWHKNTRRTPITLASLNKVIVQQILNLLSEILQFCRVPVQIDFQKCREKIAGSLNEFCNRWCKRENVECDALKDWKLNIFKIIDRRISFYSQNTNMLPRKPKISYRYLKSGIEEFHRKYVLVPADKAANNVVVV